MYIDESGGSYIARRFRAQKKNQKSKHDLKTK